MAKKLIVGNWKMNLAPGQASVYLHKLQEALGLHKDVEVVVCPTVLALQPLSLQVDRHKLKLGAQHSYYRDEGAYTGEVSATMLRHLVDYILVGHSERRHIFGETDHDTAQKVQAVLRNGMQPILCVGETKLERAEGETVSVLHGQVMAGLSNVSAGDVANLVIAYEPVWAIGTGDFASVEDAVDAIKNIRLQVQAMFGANAAEAVRVLYGGSVNANNAGSYLSAPGLDGLLIGGASLKAPEFVRIVETAGEIASGGTNGTA